jgi:putative heme-binding domain-containing protein
MTLLAPRPATLLAQAKQKQPPAKKAAPAPEDLFAAEGFKVELVYTADPAVDGSFINMGFDGQGRLIASGQRGQAITRFTLKDGVIEKKEKLDLPISEVMGTLWAFDSLYLNGFGPDKFGLYRCKEGKDGKWDVKFLKGFGGAGEHGPHGIAKGPDNKLYIMNGNHTQLPEGLSKDSPHRNYKEDHLLPRQWDGNGHAAGLYAPGGYVVRMDENGQNAELFCAGFRNAYDLAFNADGELFTFDSDMEWDWGMPWYRPTRVNHCTSGSEHGWRSGTGKWPEYYPDSLAPVVNIGIGSPTGVSNGLGAKFPAKYQKAIYILDWSYGRVMAVHLQPKGSTYSATFENFVCPLGLMKKDAVKKPLNVTDIAICPTDGSMYFTIGGRGTQGAIYRVTYVGKEETAPVEPTPPVVEARETRRSLESFQGKQNPQATNAAIKQLSQADRTIRYAARVALESQPVVEWKTMVLKDDLTADGRLTGLLALARAGQVADLPDLLTALESLPISKLNETQQLDKLRVLQVAFSRMGMPSLPAQKKLLAELDPLFPGSNELMNREVFQLLVYLTAPKLAERTLKHMAAAKTQEDQFHYLFHLRTLPIGQWTPAERKEYLSYFTKERKKLPPAEGTVKWFTDAGRAYSDGNSFNNFMKNFFKEAVANMSEAERKEHAELIASIDKSVVPSYDVPSKPFVKKWAVADLESKVAQGGNAAKGRDAYFAAQCVKCHRCGTEGGAIGPDLTAISARFDRKAVLESILEPSKVLSDQYQNEIVATLDGKVVVGRVIEDSPTKLVIQPNPLDPKRVEVAKADIESRKPSPVSPMPANLADVLTEQEFLDLLAYMESGGKKK